MPRLQASAVHLPGVRMSTHKKLPGRLRGGLSRFRTRAADRFRLAGFVHHHRDALSRLGWNVAGGLVGTAIGLMGVTLWLRYR